MADQQPVVPDAELERRRARRLSVLKPDEEFSCKMLPHMYAKAGVRTLWKLLKQSYSRRQVEDKLYARCTPGILPPSPFDYSHCGETEETLYFRADELADKSEEEIQALIDARVPRLIKRVIDPGQKARLPAGQAESSTFVYQVGIHAWFGDNVTFFVKYYKFSHVQGDPMLHEFKGSFYDSYLDY